MNLEKAKIKLLNWATDIDFDTITSNEAKKELLEDISEAINIVLCELNRLQESEEDLMIKKETEDIVLEKLNKTKVEWISVCDRLPEEETKVLVCIEYKTIETAYIFLDTWYDWVTNSPVKGGEVYYWAELPELSKEEE